MEMGAIVYDFFKFVSIFDFPFSFIFDTICIPIDAIGGINNKTENSEKEKIKVHNSSML